MLKFLLTLPWLCLFCPVLMASTTQTLLQTTTASQRRTPPPIFVKADDTGWVRPASPTDPHIWGLTDGVLFGLPSEGGMRGPRGLIRIGVLNTSGSVELINFIAVEPVVTGKAPRHMRMSYSELEMSQLDPGKRGKRFWTNNPTGTLITSGTRQGLRVRIEVEPFTPHKAHVYVIATIFKDTPHEIQFAVHHHGDSAPIQELTLTATMGNKARLRHLWLKDQIIDSRELYAGYNEDEFVEKHDYPRSQMLTWKSDPIALSTTDEEDPSCIIISRRPSWSCPLGRMTQYWRVPASEAQDNLRTRVNGRRVYWAGNVLIPGGISYENFELRQKYVPGQTFVYGILPREPHEFDPPISHLAEEPTRTPPAAIQQMIEPAIPSFFQRWAQ